MISKRFYPILILSLLGGFLLFSGWSAYRAATRGSTITDREYYSKGLKYNSTLVEKRAASVLGWQLSSRLSGQQLQIHLSDAKGEPVTGAVGRLFLYSLQNRPNSNLELTETSSGAYQVLLPAELRGELGLRVDFERDGARISRQLLLNL